MYKPANGAMAYHARISMGSSPECCSIASLGSSLACAPAEKLRNSQELQIAHRTKVKKHQQSVWFFATWNVRSLVDIEGSVETARQSTETHQAEDRRIDQVIRELKRYQVSVAALQETKWFGNAVYHVDDCVVLAAGHPTPSAGQPKQRGEGTAIVLSGAALEAWKAGGREWTAWSSRIVSASLATGKQNSSKLHVISCYTPTFGASRAEKNEFFDNLQQILDKIPSREQYVILGDFNARVGSRESEDDQWGRVYGPHGFGALNEAGRELLSFLAINEATVCNTWFWKKEIYKQTWQHPRSKQWHCIDYVIMRQRDRKRCLDVCVKRGAECHTDHQLVRLKMRMTGRRKFECKHQRGSAKRFNVAKLMGKSTDDNGQNTTRGMFQEQVCSLAKEKWNAEGTVEEKWTAIKTALTETAQSVLGKAGR